MAINRDEFFAKKAKAALWDVAVSIKRGNPLPLDADSVFESYAELEAYAQGVLAYPGQVVSVVNADSTGVYYLDQALAIHEVGKVPVGDNKSIEINNEVISLHDFGKAYYKYVEATDNIAAHYEKTEGWVEKALEPKVVSEEGVLVLGWFEPNPTTIEGINSQVAALQTGLEDVKSILGTPATETAEATGLYAKADITYVDEKVADAITKADHLTRKIFDKFDDAKTYAESNEDADKYVYMVLTTETPYNKYDEYLCVNGTLEKIGAWEVDLSDYVQKEEGKSLVSDTEIAKLGTVKENAEPNFVKSVSEELSVDVEGKLSVTKIAQSKVEGLEDTLNDKIGSSAFSQLQDKVTAVEGSVGTLDTKVSGLEERIGTVETNVSNLETKLNDYVTTETFNEQINELKTAVTWQEL